MVLKSEAEVQRRYLIPGKDNPISTTQAQTQQIKSLSLYPFAARQCLNSADTYTSGTQNESGTRRKDEKNEEMGLSKA